MNSLRVGGASDQNLSELHRRILLSTAADEWAIIFFLCRRKELPLIVKEREVCLRMQLRCFFSREARGRNRHHEKTPAKDLHFARENFSRMYDLKLDA